MTNNIIIITVILMQICYIIAFLRSNDSATSRAFLSKFLSGRFLAFIMITATLCYCSILSLKAALGIIKVDPAVKDNIEKVAMFILGSFTTIATGVYKEYFDRSDRNKQNLNVTETKQ